MNPHLKTSVIGGLISLAWLALVSVIGLQFGGFGGALFIGMFDGWALLPFVGLIKLTEFVINFMYGYGYQVHLDWFNYFTVVIWQFLWGAFLTYLFLRFNLLARLKQSGGNLGLAKKVLVFSASALAIIGVGLLSLFFLLAGR